MFSGGYRESIDVWAAGALLYKIVTGHTPFESEYHHQTIQNIREAQFQFPMVFNKYSNDLKNLIAKMLKKDPEERLTVNGCLTEVWFSKLYTESKKGKNLLNGQTFQPNTKNKMKMSAMLSMRAK